MNILSKEVDVIGTDRYRAAIDGIPLMFQPTVEIEAKPNTSGTNNRVTVSVKVPVVKQIDGVHTSSRLFNARATFTSLQDVTNDSERAYAIDLLIEALKLARDDIMVGQLSAKALKFTTTKK